MATNVVMKPPAKPRTPMYYFTQKCIKENEIEASSNFHERWSHARKLFSRLTDEEKVIYISMSVEDKKRYQKELKEFCAKNPEFKVHQPYRDIVSKSEKNLYERLNGRPKRPPSCGYLTFSTEVIPLLKGLDPHQRMLKISHIWKQQTPELVKAEYEFQSQKANFEYLTAIDEYVSKMSTKERRRIFKEEKIKYPSERKLQTMKVAIDACEEAESMDLEDLTSLRGLVDDAIVLYSHQKLLEKIQKEPEYEGECDTLQAQEEWLSLDEDERINYLRKVYTCRLINDDTERQDCGKLNKFLPAQPVTGSIKSDLRTLKKILSDRPKGKLMNGYALFQSRKLNDITGIDPRARMKKIAKMWNDLSEMEKDEFSFEAKLANELLSAEQVKFEESLDESQKTLLWHYLKKYRKRRSHYKRASLIA